MLEINWKKTQGTQEVKPVVLDLVSSPTTVYLRKNIAQVTVREQDGGSHKAWQYDEAAISRADYEKEPAAIYEMAALIEQADESQRAYADILLGQIDTQAQLEAQDAALADILLNVVGV